MLSMDDLILRVNDINCIISLKEFEQYMKYMQWAYKLQKRDGRCTLSYVDSKCTFLHIPSGVDDSKCLFSDVPSPDTKIIFNPEFTYCGRMCEGVEGVELKWLHFQGRVIGNGDKVGCMCGEGFSNIKAECINIENVTEVTNTFNNCEIKKITCTCSYLFGSFNTLKNCNECRINIRHNDNVSGIRPVSESLCNMENSSLYLVCESNTAIQNSVYQCTRCNIDVRMNGTSKNNKHITYYKSFNILNNCNVAIDKNIDKISLSFKDCTGTGTIKQDIEHSSLIELQSSFISSYLKEIRLPDTVQDVYYVEDEDLEGYPKIVFTGNIRELNTDLIGGAMECMDVDYDTDTIESMGNVRAIKKLPKTLKRFGKCLRGYLENQKEFCTDICPMVEELESNQFDHCGSLQRLIIGNNIKDLDDSFVMCGCIGLKDIILGDNIENIVDIKINTNRVINIYVKNKTTTYETLMDWLTVNNHCSQLFNIVEINDIKSTISNLKSYNLVKINRSIMLINNSEELTEIYGCIKDDIEAMELFPQLYKLTKRMTTIHEFNSQFNIKVPPKIHDINPEGRSSKPLTSKILRNMHNKIDRYVTNALNRGANIETVKHVYESCRKLYVDMYKLACIDIEYSFSIDIEYLDSLFNNSDSYRVAAGYDKNAIVRIDDSYIASIRDDAIEFVLYTGVFNKRSFGVFKFEQIKPGLFDCGMTSMYDTLEDSDDIIADVHDTILSLGKGRAIIHDWRLSTELAIAVESQFIAVAELRVPFCGDIIYDIFTGRYMLGKNSNSVLTRILVQKKFNTLDETLEFLSKVSKKHYYKFDTVCRCLIE